MENEHIWPDEPRPNPCPQPPQLQPQPRPASNWIPWAILVAILAFLNRDKLVNPPSPAPTPDPPPVVNPDDPVTPVPPTPDEPIVPSPGDPDEPELDGTALVAREEALKLPAEVHEDIAKVAKNWSEAADLIGAKLIRTDVECQSWLSVENRRDFSNAGSWEPWLRAIQARLKVVKADGRMKDLGDWAREFQSIARGLETIQ